VKYKVLLKPIFFEIDFLQLVHLFQILVIIFIVNYRNLSGCGWKVGFIEKYLSCCSQSDLVNRWFVSISN